MTRKTGLGRGLDALIPAGSEFERGGTSQSGVQQIATNRVRPNPRQPRTNFDSAELSELAASVKEHGILQPLLVTLSEIPGDYILIAGERRLLAARQCGLETVPAIVREASDLERMELALIENVQRADLSPLETAEAYRQLAEEFGMAHDKIADRVGKSRVSVTNTLRLLKLPAAVQQALAEGKISEGHARALLGLPTATSQAAALQTILINELNVRQSEELVRRLCGEKPERTPRPAPPPELLEIEERLRQRLGTKVSLNRRKQGGTLVIHYYSEEELNALVQRILEEA